MSTVLAVQPEARLARPLKTLVQLIKDEVANGREAAKEAAKPFFQRAGDMFLEAKTQLPHGDFRPWVKDNFDYSISSVNEWMVYAKLLPEHQKNGAAGYLRKPPTLTEIARPNRDRQTEYAASWQSSVREIINDKLNVPKMVQERQDKEKEEKLQRQLGLQLIDIGYKVLATKLHPDKGGSQEAMVRLQQVRDKLKGAI